MTTTLISHLPLADELGQIDQLGGGLAGQIGGLDRGDRLRRETCDGCLEIGERAGVDDDLLDAFDLVVGQVAPADPIEDLELAMVGGSPRPRQQRRRLALAQVAADGLARGALGARTRPSRRRASGTHRRAVGRTR